MCGCVIHVHVHVCINWYACMHLLLLQSALEVAVNSGNSSALVDLLNVLHLKRYSTCIAHAYISVYSIHVCIVLLILVHVYSVHCTCSMSLYMYMYLHTVHVHAISRSFML